MRDTNPGLVTSRGDVHDEGPGTTSLQEKSSELLTRRMCLSVPLQLFLFLGIDMFT